MNLKAIVILTLIITAGILACGFYLVKIERAKLLATKNQNAEAKSRICFGEHCFIVKLARSGEERSRGLMFQKSLSADEGMFFIFEKEAKYPFWMKNTLIPLDIIWISEAKKVVFISENNQPCGPIYCPLVRPTADAKYVLEVNSGTAKKIGLKLGDELKWIY